MGQARTVPHSLRQLPFHTNTQQKALEFRAAFVRCVCSAMCVICCLRHDTCQMVALASSRAIQSNYSCDQECATGFTRGRPYCIIEWQLVERIHSDPSHEPDISQFRGTLCQTDREQLHPRKRTEQAAQQDTKYT